MSVNSGPRFHRADGEPPDRLDTIEEYLARKEEFDRERQAAADKGFTELEARVGKLEGWKIDVLVFIGATKIKWAAVSFVTAIAASVLTAALIKMVRL